MLSITACGGGGGGGGGGSDGPVTLPTAASPVFSPGAASFTTTQSVTLSSTTAGAQIRYTVDGSTPTATVGSDYSAALALNGTTTIRAYARKSGYTDSPVVQATFTRLAPVTDAPPSRAEAARFLNQATFGARLQDIDRLMAIGYNAWFEEQFALPVASYFAWEQAYDLDSKKYPNGIRDNTNYKWSAFYNRAIPGPDQLRQRMVWALSQILVVSGKNSTIEQSPYWRFMSYADSLATDAFSPYRTLLEKVTFQWYMGLMLTYSGNEEKISENRFADQNYAREIMQLFSIGLYELNPDGSRKLVNGNPVSTYTQADIEGLARVFTGINSIRDETGEVSPYMIFPYADPYADSHSAAEKRFLNVVIPALKSGRSTLTTAQADVNLALDTLCSHPNIGPFLGRQLIQRFVTSNPSPGYITRVSQTWADDGKGVRGNLKAVLKAVLLDPEARDRTIATQASWGKVREPILRSCQFQRVLDAKTRTGQAYVGGIIWSGSRRTKLGGVVSDVDEQRPFHATTVFNFYRPGYAPPGTRLNNNNLVAPELQLMDTVTAADWSSYVIQSLDANATGPTLTEGVFERTNVLNYEPFLAVAGSTGDLVDRIDLLLFGGLLSTQARKDLTDTITEIADKGAGTPSRTNRVKAALALAFIHPEYLVQK